MGRRPDGQWLIVDHHRTRRPGTNHDHRVPHQGPERLEPTVTEAGIWARNFGAAVTGIAAAGTVALAL
jgi:hypothetical protein